MSWGQCYVACTPIEWKKLNLFYYWGCLNPVSYIISIDFYFIPFPLLMGEGKPACRQAGMGVDLSDLVPPHLNPPPPWGEENTFGSIGVILLLLFTHCRKSSWAGKEYDVTLITLILPPAFGKCQEICAGFPVIQAVRYPQTSDMRLMTKMIGTNLTLKGSRHYK